MLPHTLPQELKYCAPKRRFLGGLCWGASTHGAPHRGQGENTSRPVERALGPLEVVYVTCKVDNGARSPSDNKRTQKKKKNLNEAIDRRIFDTTTKVIQLKFEPITKEMVVIGVLHAKTCPD